LAIPSSTYHPVYTEPLSLNPPPHPQVERAVLIKYLRATKSMGLGAFVIVLYLATIAVLLAADWWLSYWMRDTRPDTLPDGSVDPEKNDGRGLLFYLGVYSLISLAAIVVTYLRQLGLLHMSVKASKSLHDELFESVLHCPLSFFDTTPVGRITARFSRDVDTIDQTLADSISQFFQVGGRGGGTWLEGDMGDAGWAGREEWRPREVEGTVVHGAGDRMGTPTQIRHLWWLSGGALPQLEVPLRAHLTSCRSN
jgi:hypothetical protein